MYDNQPNIQFLRICYYRISKSDINRETRVKSNEVVEEDDEISNRKLWSNFHSFIKKNNKKYQQFQ